MGAVLLAFLVGAAGGYALRTQASKELASRVVKLRSCIDQDMNEFPQSASGYGFGTDRRALLLLVYESDCLYISDLPYITDADVKRLTGVKCCVPTPIPHRRRVP